MQQAHIIRLRKPWTARVLARLRHGTLTQVDEPPQPVDVPGGWPGSLEPDFRGRVQLIRHFNRPTGIENGMRVQVYFGAVEGRAEVSLNGHSLGEISWSDAPQRFDITDWLANRNELQLTISRLDEPESTLDPTQRGRRDSSELLGEVHLEIR